MENIKRFKFENHKCPTSQFDLLELEVAFAKEEYQPLLTKLHLVEFYLIVLITDGEGIHTIDFNEYRYQKGTVLTIRKDQIHKYHINPSTRGYMIFFTEQFVTSAFDEKESQKLVQVFNELLSSPKIQLSASELTDISTMMERLKTEYFDTQDEYTFSILRSELQIMMTKLARNKNKTHPITTTHRYINEFITFQTLVENKVTESSKVSYYAKEMGYSVKTLNTITKSILNKSAKAFIDEIYIKQIKRLLLNTQYPIKEIAYQTGFEEISNFYKYFKKHIQLTPEQFRATS